MRLLECLHGGLKHGTWMLRGIGDCLPDAAQKVTSSLASLHFCASSPTTVACRPRLMPVLWAGSSWLFRVYLRTLASVGLLPHFSQYWQSDPCLLARCIVHWLHCYSLP